MYDVNTPLGSFWVDNFSAKDTRIGIRDVERVDNMGPDSTFRWSADQEDALHKAAGEVGATLDLLVPGGWRVQPGTALPALEKALTRIAATMPRSSRMTAPR